MRSDFYWFRVHDHVDEHPKIEPLSDAAFRLLFETWAYCRRTRNDGRISDAVWRKRGHPRPRKELADCGLVEQHGGYVQVHDYLEWQQSAAEIDEARGKKAKASALGNHTKWHANRGQVDPACEFCGAPPDGPDPTHMGSQMGSQMRSQERPNSLAEIEGEGENLGYVERGGYVPSARDAPPLYPDHCRQHARTAEPGPCGNCADARKANVRRPLALVPPDTQKCLVHAEPDVTHCRGCAADRKAADTA